jgi:hypothetical protein
MLISGQISRYKAGNVAEGVALNEAVGELFL